ncbi:DUF11 domain-containing protein [Aliidiomarina celeris]|uniref:DUF11 domain-containing protein n=1 Tax=Aliidiomarina celeris TaxID=2249428 RepID=UPI000DE87607|nr:DUF11 domain-containing protein [Aliidiomarina celeris]
MGFFRLFSGIVFAFFALFSHAVQAQQAMQCSPQALDVSINEVFGGGAGQGNLEFLELYINEPTDILNFQVHWYQNNFVDSFFLGRGAFDGYAVLPDGTIVPDNNCPANLCSTPTTFPRGTFLLYDLKSVSPQRAEFLLTDSSNYVAGATADQLRNSLAANQPLAVNHFYFYANFNNRIQNWVTPLEPDGCGIFTEKGSNERDISRLTDGSGDMFTEYPDGSAVQPTTGASNMGGNDSVAEQFDTAVNLVKLANTTEAAPGESVEFTISVTNNGPVTATNVVVTDIFPTGQLTYDGNIRSLDGGVNQSFGQFAISGNTFTWSFTTLPTGSIATLIIYATVRAGVTGNITNTASVDIAQTNIGNPTNFATISVTASDLSYLQLSHVGTTSACSSYEVSITACTGALSENCSVQYTDGISGTLVAGANSVPFSIPNGSSSTVVDIFVPFNGVAGDAPQTVVLSTQNETGVPSDSSSPYCQKNSGTINNTSACEVTVSGAELSFDVPDFISGIEQGPIQLSAIGLDGGQQCVPLFQDVTRDIAFTSDYVNPSTGTLPLVLNSQNLTGSLILSLPFDSNGVTSIASLDYFDAGLKQLTATYNGSAVTNDNGMVIVGEDNFVVRPASFQFTDIVCPVGSSNEVTSASGPGGLSAFCRAGEGFGFTINAINALGQITPNFGNENVPVAVSLSATPVLPSPGNGTIGVFTNPSPTFINGIANVTSGYSEVGIIQAQAETDNAYLGSQLVSGQSPNIGRFIPAYFEVSTNVPEFSAHQPGVFHYQGQPMDYFIEPMATLIARNMQGNITLNYYNTSTGLFRYEVPAIAEISNANYASIPNINSAVPNVGTIALEPIVGNEHDVVLTQSTFAFLRSPTDLRAPFNPANVDLTLELNAAWFIDDDGVCIRNNANAANCEPVVFNVEYSEQRYGRLVLENIFGPEDQVLDIKAYIEYWDGTRFVPNEDDDNTSLNPLRFTILSSPFVTDPTILGGATTVQNGALPPLSMSWQNEDAPDIGEFEFSYILGDDNLSTLSSTDQPWLKFNWSYTPATLGAFDNPRAFASFGQYRGNDRIIFWLELR